MNQSEMWRWADEQGEQRLVGAQELRTAIANGVLPPSTLVWREGMSAWMAASSIADFADAVKTGAAHERHRATSGESAGRPNASPAANTRGSTANGVGSTAVIGTTLQGINASDVVAAASAAAAAKEKRTPSGAPPRVNAGGERSATTKTLRPNSGPAIPAPARVPPEAAKPPFAPRPVGPVRTPAPAPPPRAPSTTAIDKAWSFSDDETTNVGGKDKSVQARPEPPAESAAHEVPSADAAASRMPQPSRTSVVRSAPPPSPHAERIRTEETTESATFQFAKNTLSLRAGKLAPATTEDNDGSEARAPGSREKAQRAASPSGLMEEYGKQAVARHEKDDAAEASAEFGITTQDLEPAYAQKTAKMPYLPEPPKMREPAATTMLPTELEEADADKPPHEVSRTIRMAADFLSKVLGPALMPKTARIDTSNDPVLQQLRQIKPPPLPPASAIPEGQLQPQFVRLPSATPHAATSAALRAVQAPAPVDPAPPQLPLNALLMSGAMLITMVIGAFFVGRCSVKPTASNDSMARAGIANAARATLSNLPGPPKPCWVAKQPARYATAVSKSIPFELLALASGKVAIGHAKGDDEAVGIEVTPATGRVDERFAEEARSEIARVTPTGKGFFISTAEPPGSLKSLIPVSAEKPFYLGISDKHIAMSSEPSGVAAPLWPITGDDSPSGGLRVSTLNDRGFAVALRTGSSRQVKVLAGMLGPDRKPVTNLVHVAGSGGQVSEPMIGSNGREVAIVFGDQASEHGSWKVRIGRAPMGKVPSSTTMFETPAGGPGGDANHPAIAGLADGRWVLVWTEGSSGSKAVRAQTFATNFVAVGDPIVLSPPGNFGQSALGVVGNHVVVVFVQKSKSNHELWGSVLQCG